MENANPLKNPTSNFIGYILFILSIGMYVYPKFYELKEAIQWYIPLGCFALGFICILAPDDIKGLIDSFVEGVKKFISKKADA